MEQKLKVTNALSDPTRFNIYQYIIKSTNAATVNEVAKEFDIHPNVARMHLSKLEDVELIISYTKKTGKGGRPSRLYELADDIIELNFPHRDYKLLSTIALDTLTRLGDPGRKALYDTGYEYGKQVIRQYKRQSTITMDEKLQILEEAGKMLGMYASFTYSKEDDSITYSINNCPFKEIASKDHAICDMHKYFLKGMFEALFTHIKLSETNNIFDGCENCTYIAKLSVI
ncbi:helix-turn-helix domain-containing protein [Cerasibacillus terrae]|uniref:Helix-turn-helix domain-containing protein n=1 Tax=Cerasibacillus terrae TaxID=2498845 RepID=A0A5C8P2V8_9BACI|nr:helix-turn-helix domain-containing protein [Cerasibacillus terrae]TXL67970.1 helix-turn-helix domain-containing protein [Cerasibacillus terrae]